MNENYDVTLEARDVRCSYSNQNYECIKMRFTLRIECKNETVFILILTNCRYAIKMKLHSF